MGEKELYLSVPTHGTKDTKIKDVLIDNSKPWRRKHFQSILRCYNKAPYSEAYMPLLEEVYEKEWEKLSDLNIHIIKLLSNILDIKTRFIKSSELNARGKRTDLLLDICKILDADKYISSIGALNYLKEDGAFDLFNKENIELEIVEYEHPTYPQLNTNFISHLSIIDFLFNCGSDTSLIF